MWNAAHGLHSLVPKYHSAGTHENSPNQVLDTCSFPFFWSVVLRGFNLALSKGWRSAPRPVDRFGGLSHAKKRVLCYGAKTRGKDMQVRDLESDFDRVDVSPRHVPVILRMVGKNIHPDTGWDDCCVRTP